MKTKSKKEQMYNIVSIATGIVWNSLPLNKEQAEKYLKNNFQLCSNIFKIVPIN